MWQAGSASVGVTPNRVLGEGARHFLEPNDSINRRMGKVGKKMGTLSLPAALASGPDSVVSRECFSFTCVPASWGWGWPAVCCLLMQVQKQELRKSGVTVIWSFIYSGHSSHYLRIVFVVVLFLMGEW